MRWINFFGFIFLNRSQTFWRYFHRRPCPIKSFEIPDRSLQLIRLITGLITQWDALLDCLPWKYLLNLNLWFCCKPSKIWYLIDHSGGRFFVVYLPVLITIDMILVLKTYLFNWNNCQASSLSCCLALILWERADTIITFHPPLTTENFLST